MMNLKRIFLMLGPACNLQCKYCLQHDMVDEAHAELSDETLLWLKERAKRQFSKIALTFYGGEPLVYWATIKDVLTKLEGLFKFSIITNGKLLDAEKVDLLNDYGVSVAISWDGKNVMQTRGYDAMTNPCIMDLKQLSVSGVMSVYNYPLDFLDSLEPFFERYNEKNGHYPGINIDTIMDFGNCADLRDVDLTVISDQMQKICESDRLIDKMLADGIYSRGFHNDLFGENEVAACQNGVTIWNVDPAGNLYRCHNTGYKLGTIRDNELALLARAINRDPTYDNYKKCKDCEVQPFCNNGCPLVDETGRESYYCGIRKAYFKPFAEKLSAAQHSEEGKIIKIGS